MDFPEAMLFDQEGLTLKISVIVVATLFPAIIAFIIYRYNRIIKYMKKAHETSHFIVQKRIEAFEHIGPKLHEMISFYCYSGSWKEISPIDIMRLKKELDKDIGSKTPLFSHSLTEKFNGFIQLCYVSSTGWEHKEKIKSLYVLRQENNVEWNNEWIKLFDTNNVVDAIKMRDRYNELMEAFKNDINPI